MQIATKVITGLGAILTVVALGWLLTGAFDYFSGRKNQNPQQCADHVISGEMTVRHVAHARNERRERSDDRYKTGENNRFAAMSLVKLMSLIKITATKDFRIWITEQFVTK